MIGYIKGKVLKISDSSITLGDQIGFSVNTNGSIYSLGQEVEIFTHMIVRENDISLWGFASEYELEMFRLLINISGVGPRTAQGLIYNVGIPNIFSAVNNSRPELLKSVGVGIKTAQKIVLELKGKLPIAMPSVGDEGLEQSDESRSLYDNVLLALVSLGYKESDVSSLLNKVISDNQSIDSEEEIIKIVLRNI